MLFRLLGSKLNPKLETKKHSEFDVVPKKDKKSEKQKTDALYHLNKAMKFFSPVLRMRVLELSRMVQLGDVSVQPYNLKTAMTLIVETPKRCAHPLFDCVAVI